MITTLDHTLKEFIQQALEDAKQTKQSVIVSCIKEVDAMDPLHFFASGEDLYLGERYFWSTPNRNFIMVGLGNELVLENNLATKERFQDIEKEWKRFKKMVVSNETSQVGTGPILFGGFSFDPLKEKSPLWDSFSEAKFVLPKQMLSVIDQKCFITINKVITHLDELSLCLKHFERSLEIDSVLPYQKDCEKGNEFSSIEYKTSDWLKAVQKATDHIKLNEMDKVVLAREVHLKFANKINPYQVVYNLQQEQPTSYIFEFENGPQHFVGATPERLIKKENNEVLSTCLAGSIKRGKTDHDDHALGQQLMHDDKNLLEHAIVVKMIKSAIESCCYNVITPGAPALFKSKNIQHLYTPVKGSAKEGFSFLTMVEKLHPTPALGGFPKDKAIEKIRELEPMHRGWYAGPLGWLDHKDNGEFVVAIRSGLLEGQNAALFAGCGIVEESNPKSEYLETKIKLKPMMSALGGIVNED